MKGNKYVYYNNGSLSKKKCFDWHWRILFNINWVYINKKYTKKKKQLKTLLNLTFWTHIVYLWNKNSKIKRNCIKFKRLHLLVKLVHWLWLAIHWFYCLLIFCTRLSTNINISWCVSVLSFKRIHSTLHVLYVSQ